MNHYVIHARDGSVLHEGDAPSQRRFLAGLLSDRVSFRGADLRGWPMNHHVLDGRDFRGADLTGADLSGASACGTDLSGAVLAGVKGDGLRALNARLVRADLGREAGVAARFRGGDFTGADMALADLDGTDLSGASLRAVRLTKAALAGAVLRDCDLVNAEFGLASVVGCDLKGADLSSSTGSPLMSMPDRTVDARVCDNTYGETRFDEGVPAFGRDRRAGKLMRAASWGVSALAVAGVANLVPEEAGSEMLRHLIGHWSEGTQGVLSSLVGNGLVLLAAVKLASFIRETVEHVSQEHVGKGVLRGLRAAKAYAREAVARGFELGHLVAAAVRGPGLGAVRNALALAADEGSFLREVVTGDARLILCDRAHLARALARLHVEHTRGLAPGRDLVLLRARPAGEAGEEWVAPTALRLDRDGGVRAVWRRDGRHASATWDATGELLATRGFREAPPSMGQAKAAFERALWSDHGLRPAYLTNGHQIVAGRDGSIQVVHERTGRLSNPWGPAFIGRDGAERHFRQGVEIEPEEIAAPAP